MIRRLHEDGYTAVAAANPIRSLSGDAEFVASIVDSIDACGRCGRTGRIGEAMVYEVRDHLACSGPRPLPGRPQGDALPRDRVVRMEGRKEACLLRPSTPVGCRRAPVPTVPIVHDFRQR